MKQTTEFSAHSDNSQHESLTKDQNEEKVSEARNLFFNMPKIRRFSKIQEKLIDWQNDLSESNFESIFSEIPSDYLNNKEDLKTICELFAKFCRHSTPPYKRLGIKLFERIMTQIKTYLSDESEFFWEIFGQILYYKLWLYEEGLISIETIILKSNCDKTGNVAKYFMPEIISLEPEYFDLELKFKFNLQVSDEMKDKRAQYFKWLKSSGNYEDEEYRQLQNDPLLLSIKTDDLNLFQDTLSKTNRSIDFKCSENLVEHYFLRFNESSLIELACEYYSTNILQFLLLNQAQLSNDLIQLSVQSKNYEMIHFAESKMEIDIVQLFYYSLIYWNFEMIDYCIETYNFNISKQTPEVIFTIFEESFSSMNFIFIESYLIPYLNSNIDFYNSHVNDILFSSITNYSCFFFKELLKNPNVNVNYDKKTPKQTLLTHTFAQSNSTASLLLLNHPQIDVNKEPKNFLYSPFQIAIAIYSDPTVLKKLCLHPKFNINYSDPIYNINAFELICSKGHIYGLSILFDIFPDYQDNNPCNAELAILDYFIEHNLIYSLKLVIQFILKQNRTNSTKIKNKIIETLKSVIESSLPFKDEYRDSFRKMLSSLH